MKNPSKRVAAMNEQARLKQQAVIDNDPEGFAAAVAELLRLDQTEDTYTCLSCGKDFPDGPHVDLLVAAILVYGDDGREKANQDYGILATERQENGRRIKVCETCMNSWAIPILEYVEMR